MGTFEIFCTNFGILHEKEALKLIIHASYENELEPNLWLIAQKKPFVLDSSLGIISK